MIQKYNIIEINKTTTESKTIEQKDTLEEAAERAYELNKEVKEKAKQMGLSEHPYCYDFVPDESIITSTPIKEEDKE